MKKFLLIILLILAISSTILNLLKFFSSKNYSPQSIAVSNIDANKASISYTTKNPARGSIVYSKSPLVKMLVLLFPIHFPFLKSIPDDHNKILTTHHITINGLNENQTYYYSVISGNFIYTQSDNKSYFKTSISQARPNIPKPIYGEVRIDNKNGLPASYSLIYLFINKKVYSTFTNSQGRWSLDLSREETLPSVIDVFVNGGILGNKSDKLYSNQIQPTQTIFLN